MIFSYSHNLGKTILDTAEIAKICPDPSPSTSSCRGALLAPCCILPVQGIDLPEQQLVSWGWLSAGLALNQATLTQGDI